MKLQVTYDYDTVKKDAHAFANAIDQIKFELLHPLIDFIKQKVMDQDDMKNMQFLLDEQYDSFWVDIVYNHYENYADDTSDIMDDYDEDDNDTDYEVYKMLNEATPDLFERYKYTYFEIVSQKCMHIGRLSEDKIRFYNFIFPSPAGEHIVDDQDELMSDLLGMIKEQFDKNVIIQKLNFGKRKKRCIKCHKNVGVSDKVKHKKIKTEFMY